MPTFGESASEVVEATLWNPDVLDEDLKSILLDLEVFTGKYANMRPGHKFAIATKDDKLTTSSERCSISLGESVAINVESVTDRQVIDITESKAWNASIQKVLEPDLDIFAEHVRRAEQNCEGTLFDAIASLQDPTKPCLENKDDSAFQPSCHELIFETKHLQVAGEQPIAQLPCLQITRQPSLEKVYSADRVQTSALPKLGSQSLGSQASKGRGTWISPGDVLNIRGQTNALSRLGATGGFMGHVLLAVSEAASIPLESELGEMFYEYSANGQNPLYSVRVVECSRARPGLSESTLFLYTSNGSVFICGEDDGELGKFEEAEEMHIWHGPSAFCDKGNFNLFVMQQVLADMRASQLNWSWTTAVRAFLLSGSHDADVPVTLEEITASWKVEPICSGMVVSFWQQYLFWIAKMDSTDPLQLIFKNMPLKADRVLPGELLQCLVSHGWNLAKVPSHPMLGVKDGVQRSHSL